MSELKEFLSRTPFFGGLPAETMDRLVKMLVERSYKAGSEVFREGDAGKSMYVVHSGELVANQAGGSGGTVRLMRFFEGDFFGEMTLIELQPRPFTVAVWNLPVTRSPLSKVRSYVPAYAPPPLVVRVTEPERASAESAPISLQTASLAPKEATAK